MIDKIIRLFKSVPSELELIAWEAANISSLEELEPLTQRFQAEAMKRLTAVEAWDFTQANRGSEMCIEAAKNDAHS